MGIAVERSLEMAVGLLGIMKSGGSFVPLDMSYPRERPAFMLRDSRVGLLLTQEFLHERLPEVEVELILMDAAGRRSLSREARTSPARSPGRTSPISFTPRVRLASHVEFWSLIAVYSTTTSR